VEEKWQFKRECRWQALVSEEHWQLISSVQKNVLGKRRISLKFFLTAAIGKTGAAQSASLTDTFVYDSRYNFKRLL